MKYILTKHLPPPVLFFSSSLFSNTNNSRQLTFAMRNHTYLCLGPHPHWHMIVLCTTHLQPIHIQLDLSLSSLRSDKG